MLCGKVELQVVVIKDKNNLHCAVYNVVKFLINCKKSFLLFLSIGFETIESLRLLKKLIKTNVCFAA